MGKPYSEDLRRNVVRAIESGHTYEEAAELCGVSVSSVSRFLTRWRSTGSVSAEKFGGYKGYALERYRDRITRWLGGQPDITLAELQARLAKERVVVSQLRSSVFFAIWVSLLKKKPTRSRARPAGRGRSTEGSGSFNRQPMGGDRLEPRRLLAVRMRRIPHECWIQSTLS
jgi:transposase